MDGIAGAQPVKISLVSTCTNKAGLALTSICAQSCERSGHMLLDRACKLLSKQWASGCLPAFIKGLKKDYLRGGMKNLAGNFHGKRFSLLKKIAAYVHDQESYVDLR